MHGIVKPAQDSPFLILDDGWQLVQISYQEHLYPSKWNLIVAFHMTHPVVNRIQHIGAQHTDFVNYQKINRLEDFSPELIEWMLACKCLLSKKPLSICKIAFWFTRRQKGTIGKQKLRMDGHSSSIQCSDSRRSHDYKTFVRLLCKFPQKSGFSSACFTRQKNRSSRGIYKSRRELQSVLRSIHLAKLGYCCIP